MGGMNDLLVFDNSNEIRSTSYFSTHRVTEDDYFPRTYRPSSSFRDSPEYHRPYDSSGYRPLPCLPGDGTNDVLVRHHDESPNEEDAGSEDATSNPIRDDLAHSFIILSSSSGTKFV